MLYIDSKRMLEIPFRFSIGKKKPNRWNIIKTVTVEYYKSQLSLQFQEK